MNKYFLSFILALLIFFLHIYYSKHAIYGDGNGYYAYAHALYFERKFDFEPIYNYLSNFKGRDYTFSRVFWDTRVGHNGIRHNMWTIGTSLFWIPSLFLIDIFGKLFNLHLSKFNLIFEIGPGITGIILMLSGIYFLEKYLLSFFPKNTVNKVIISIIFATNFGYFLFFEPALSHQPAFFLISLLLYKTYDLKFTNTNFFFIGILSGLLFITRMVDAILLLPIIWLLSKNIKNLRNNSKLFGLPRTTMPRSLDRGSIKNREAKFPNAPTVRSWVRGLLILGIILGVLPQLIVQHLMFGKFWENTYLTGEQGRFLFDINQMISAFFSAQRGLFTWSPLFLLGLVGLGIYTNKKISHTSNMFLITVLFYFILLSMWNCILAAGFGNRFFLSSVPFLAVGLANIFNKLSKKRTVAIVIICIVWNTLLLGQFFSDKKRMVDGIGLTPLNFITGQITFPLKLINRL